MFVGGQAHDPQVVVGEDTQGKKVGWFLHKNDVARLGIEGADQVQAQGSAGRDEEVLHPHTAAIAPAQELGQRQPEVAVALLQAVLESEASGWPKRSAAACCMSVRGSKSAAGWPRPKSMTSGAASDWVVWMLVGVVDMGNLLLWVCAFLWVDML